MAKITNSFLGKISGAQAGVVASKWKGIQYIRAHVIPANPQTAPQTENRLLFKGVAQFLRRLVDTVLNPDFVPKPKKMSPYNRFVQINQPLQSGPSFNPAEVKIMEGTLFNPGIGNIAPHNLDGINIAYDSTIVGEADVNDRAQGAIFSVVKDTWAYGNAKRSSGSFNVDFPTAFDSGDTLHIYLYFKGKLDNIVSDSDYVGYVVP